MREPGVSLCELGDQNTQAHAHSSCCNNLSASKDKMDSMLPHDLQAYDKHHHCSRSSNRAGLSLRLLAGRLLMAHLSTLADIPNIHDIPMGCQDIWPYTCFLLYNSGVQTHASCLPVCMSAEILQFSSHPGYGSFLELYSNTSSAGDTTNWSGDLSGTYQAAQALCLDVRASTFRNNTVSIANYTGTV